jgi:hypothetical protein
MIQAEIPDGLVLRPKAGECLTIRPRRKGGYFVSGAYVGEGDELDGGILIEHGVNAVFEKKQEEERTMKKIYLTGKMTVDNNCFDTFTKAAKSLGDAGYYVVVPHDHLWYRDDEADGLPFHVLKNMRGSAGVAMLPDWKKSPNSRTAFRLARVSGIQVKPVEDWISGKPEKYEPMSIKRIVEDYLIDNRFDGLSREDCGCGLEDLFPCGDAPNVCRPAYRHKTGSDGRCRDCSLSDDDCLFEGGRDVFCVKKRPEPEQ